MKYPNKLPKIKVITEIGTKLIGSFQPIKIAEGKRIKNEIIIPLKIPFNLSSEIARINPIITHIENADKFASQVNF